MKEYRRKHGDKMRMQNLRWQKENKERRRAHHLKHRHGITLDEFNEMVVGQDGVCAICWAEMDPPHVDHDHKTGRIRGLLCQKCNMALGLLADSRESLARALLYLEVSDGVTD